MWGVGRVWGVCRACGESVESVERAWRGREGLDNRVWREGGGENGELTIVVCVARSIEYLALDFLGLRN